MIVLSVSSCELSVDMKVVNVFVSIRVVNYFVLCLSSIMGKIWLVVFLFKFGKFKCFSMLIIIGNNEIISGILLYSRVDFLSLFKLLVM